jgi:hypothetical protein
VPLHVGIERVVLPLTVSTTASTPTASAIVSTLQPEGAAVTLDFAEADDLAADLARRDLTMNAIAWDGKQFWDPFDGRKALARQSIEFISEANALDDPLRLLRVFRMASQFDAPMLHPDTLRVVQTHAARLADAAPERITYEWLKLLQGRRCFPLLQSMLATGLLEVLLPELTATRAIPANGAHHLPLLEHTLELVNQFEQLPLATFGLEPFPSPADQALIKFACLLHDIAKPATMTQGPQGRLRFYGHDLQGEAMTQVIAARFRLSNEQTRRLKRLVRWHLYPCQFGPETPRRSLVRFFHKTEPDTIPLLLLALADRLSTRGDGVTNTMIETAYAAHCWLMQAYQAHRDTVAAQPLWINGQDVMQTLQLPPGPQIGRWLGRIKEAQALGEFSDRSTALAWLLAADDDTAKFEKLY